jgi:hypothetical protein
VDAQHGGEFAAGGNAIAGAQIAGVDERAKLVTKLDVQRDVALRLEMKWQHCLSPSGYFTRYWTAARANLSYRHFGRFLARIEQAGAGNRPGRPVQLEGGL